MAQIVKLDYTFTYERGSVYGSVIDVAPKGIPTDDMTIQQAATAHRLPRAFGYRGNHESNVYQDTGSTIPTAQFGCFMTPELVVDLLPGILQTTGSYISASGVYNFHTKNYAELPSVKADNDGYFYTLTRNSPSASNDEYIASAIPSTIQLSIAPEDNDGILYANIEFIGKGYSRSQTMTGSITNVELENKFKWSEIVSASFGSYDLTTDFVSLTLNATPGTKLLSSIPDGEIVFPQWQINGTLRVIATVNTEDMKTKVLTRDVNSGEELKLAFSGNGVTPAVEGELIITSHAYLTEWSSEYDEGEIIDFTFEGVFGNAVSNEYPLRMQMYYTSSA